MSTTRWHPGYAGVPWCQWGRKLYQDWEPTRDEGNIEYETVREGHAARLDDVWGGCTPREVIGCDCEVGNSGWGDGVRGFVNGGDVRSIVAFDTSILSIKLSAGTHDVHQFVLGMFPPSPSLTTLAIIKNITDNNRRTGQQSPRHHIRTRHAPCPPPKVSATSGITLILPISASSTSSDQTHAEMMSGTVTNVPVSSMLAWQKKRKTTFRAGYNRYATRCVWSRGGTVVTFFELSG
jgi:hypothetical protein